MRIIYLTLLFIVLLNFGNPCDTGLANSTGMPVTNSEAMLAR